MSHGRFVLATLAIAVLLLLAAAGFVRLIDPYGLYAGPRVTGLNVLKPVAHNQLAAAKLARHARRKAPHLLVGNSRIDIGVAPESPTFPAVAGVAQNLGLPGWGITGLGDLLQHVEDYPDAYGTPERIFLLLDFQDFLTDEPAGVRPPPRDWRRPAPADVAARSLSLPALGDSIATILGQYARHPETMTETGFHPWGEAAATIRSAGQFVLFQQKMDASLAAHRSLPRGIRAPGGGETASMRAYWFFLEHARKTGRPLVVAIPPYHADYLDLIDRLGFWPAFEDWKRWLAVQTEAARSAGAPVSLWDFAGYNHWTTEAVPPPGERGTAMRWYFEPAHFTPALGDLMLARALGAQGGEGAVSREFGWRLTPETAEERLADVRAARSAYRAAHPRAQDRVDRYCGSAC